MNKALRIFGAAVMLLILLAFGAHAGFGAGITIGTISSTGQFELSGTETWKEGTLLEGSAIATNRTRSRLRLRAGADIRVGADSRARVYGDRLIVERGAVDAAIPSQYALEVESLGVRVTGDQTRAQLKVEYAGTTTIASLKGSLRVQGPGGLVLAHLSEGNAVQLSATGRTKASAQLAGVLVSRDHSYFLSEETTGVTVELHGEQLAKYAGKRVTIFGDVEPDLRPTGAGDFVVRVRAIEGLPATASKTKTGALSTPTKIGIIAGIAVAGGFSTGLVVAGEEESSEPVSPQP